jgi:protein MpaA
MCSQRHSPPPARDAEVRRLGNNIGGYRGETIDIGTVLADCISAAHAQGWAIEEMPLNGGPSLLALTRIRKIAAVPAVPGQGSVVGKSGVGSQSGARRLRVYLSTGIHGDEPAGPLAVRKLLRENEWPDAVDLWLCPCLNPVGFLMNRRENAGNLDLNRQYREPQASETLVHIAWLERQPRFDLCLCLHEDWESHGFYIYELNPDRRPSLAEAAVEKVSEVCPIDRSETIEGRSARNGIIRPDVDPRARPQWPEAFYLVTHKTRLSYTLEAPSDFPLTVRIAALVTAVNAALKVAPVAVAG